MRHPRYELSLPEAITALDEENKNLEYPVLQGIPINDVFALGYQKAVQDLREVTGPPLREDGWEMLVADEPLNPDYEEPKPVTDPIPEPEDG